MKAMIFAAGVGSRLKPFTDRHPKALAPVGGVPMLERVITKLIAAGIDSFVVNVHHFAEQIVDFLKAKNNFGVDIQISDETAALLDTGGGILAARQWLDSSEDILVHNVDILTDFDVSDMIARHLERKPMATLLVADRSTSRYLLFDSADDRMRGWTNRSTGELRPATLTSADGLRQLAFGGVHIISPSIFPHLQAYASTVDAVQGSIPKFSITDFYISTCSREPIIGYSPDYAYNWLDIGRPESLAAAEACILSSK